MILKLFGISMEITSCKYNPEPIHSKTAKRSECTVYFQLCSNHLHQASYRMAEYWQITKGVGLLAGSYIAIYGVPILLSLCQTISFSACICVSLNLYIPYIPMSSALQCTCLSHHMHCKCHTAVLQYGDFLNVVPVRGS